MKKLVYSLALLMMGLASCTDWDDAVTENYGAGPSIDINIQAGTPSDSAFTITLTPAAGSTYYAFVIDANDEAEELDNYTLLRGGYGNTVLNTSSNATYTINITTAAPNTTYQVYAVSSNDKGIAGQVAVANITTTDGLNPGPSTIKRDEANKAAQVNFSEAVARGTGAVTAKYFKEWDIMNPVDIAPEEISVAVKGNAVTFAAPTAPAGAYICFSWEAGAFVDGKGNPCKAFNSGLNMNTGKFSGVYVHATNVPFEIADSYVTAPEDGAVITDWQAFKGQITFAENVYRNDEAVEAGDISVIYAGENRTATYKLSPDDWAVEGNVLTFALPAEPVSGDIITVSLVEGTVTDVLGNPNASYTSAVSWKFSSWVPQVEDVLGTFSYIVTLNSNGKTYNLGNFTIEEYTGDDAEEGDVVIKNFYLEGSEMYGYYDLNAMKLYIFRYQPLGTYEEEGETYGVLTYSVGGNKNIEFDITEDGIISTDFALAYSDAEYSSLIGFEVPAGTTVLTKAAASAARKVKAGKSAIAKAKMSGARKIQAYHK